MIFLICSFLHFLELFLNISKFIWVKQFITNLACSRALKKWQKPSLNCFVPYFTLHQAYFVHFSFRIFMNLLDQFLVIRKKFQLYSITSSSQGDRWTDWHRVCRILNQPTSTVHGVASGLQVQTF